MTARINTAKVNTDFNFGDLMADERIFNLPGANSPAFLYVALQMYAMRLTATTGSEYVDGEFSRADVLIRIRGLTAEVLDTLEAVGLVWPVDGDRWAIEFTTAQSTHARLQDRAEASATANAAKKAKRVKAAEMVAQATKGRERRAEAQRRYVERKRAADSEVEEYIDADDCDEPTPSLSDSDRRWLDELDREPEQTSTDQPVDDTRCARCGGDKTPADAGISACTGCGQQYDASGRHGMRCVQCGGFAKGRRYEDQSVPCLDCMIAEREKVGDADYIVVQ